MNRAALILAIAVGTLHSQPASADTLAPGTRAVHHSLVFEASDELREHRLIASPVNGFSGVHEIVADEAFTFSSKYGTRLYLVPEGEEVAAPPAGGELPWPNCPVPVAEVTAVNRMSPVSAVRTTCALTSVEGGVPVVIEIATVELGASGEPVNRALYWAKLIGVAAVGLGLGFFFRRWLINKRRSARAS